MKLKNYQVLSLIQAIEKLDDVNAGKKPAERTSVGSEPEKFKFKASTLYALAKNHRKLKTISEDIERTRISLIKKHQDKPGEDLKGDNALAFVQEYNEFLDSEGCDVTLHTIKVDELELDKNNIPISIVSELIGTVLSE